MKQWLVYVLCLVGLACIADSSILGAPTNTVSVLLTNGTVEVSRSTPPSWMPASVAGPQNVLFPGHRLRTGDRSRAAVQLADRTIKQMGPRSLLTVLEPKTGSSRVGLLQGVFHFFHRDDPGSVEAETPSVSMVIRGTEFHVEVRQDGTTLLQLFDGTVSLENAAGTLQLQGREGAVIRPGQRPERAPALFATQVIQWALYYPAIVPVEELTLPDDRKSALQASLDAYSRGDLIQALASYPAVPNPSGNGERLYLAGLLLSVGEVNGAVAELNGLTSPSDEDTRMANAIRQLIAVTQSNVASTNLPSASTSTASPMLAAEWLVESYRLQSLGYTPRQHGTNGLADALSAARKATEIQPAFGFAWIRRAELEFSTAARDEAFVSLQRGLAISPRNAQGVALRGFVAASENRTPTALVAFDQAIELDPHLAFAWLGRGLSHIRLGDRSRGILDLEVAAALEPQRGVLRSYLGKALADAGDFERARHELELSRSFDPNDPTSWLYQALLEERENRINASIRDLEKAVQLNANRAIYRSQFLLDQDRAVQGANLARVFQDAGMSEVALHEASRASQLDYANPSARLFLAEAFEALRDPKQVQLRYETPWLNEYLMANLLAPVGMGSLSPYVSAQEFSKLFEQDRWGIVSQTEYLSRGDWHQVGVQHGTFGRSAYALEADGLWERGQWSNTDRDALTLRARVKQEVTTSDRVYLEVVRYDETSGDISQHTDPTQVNPGLRVKELQSPTVLAGWTHDWDASSHTLFLVGHLDDLYRVKNPLDASVVTLRDAITGQITSLSRTVLDQLYESQLKAWSFEAQQVKENTWLTWVLGARFQSGSFDSRGRQDYTPPGGDPTFFAFPFSYSESLRSTLERVTAYSWGYWELSPEWVAVTGISWEHLRFPANHRYSPLSTEEESRSAASPKLGLVWSPSSQTTVRGTWWRTLGGVSLEQSYQLEPTQTAGFVHAYRSLIPESVAGSSAAPKQEGASLAWDQRHSGGTYFGLQADWLKSRVDRDRGVFEFDANAFEIVPDSIREHLDYTEQGASAYLHQRLGDDWTIGARYRVSRADLQDTFLGLQSVSSSLLKARDQLRATLQTARFNGRFHHPAGFFSGAEWVWFHQSIASGGTEEIWQCNVEAGWRFARRAVELRVAVLNLLNQDYRLNPINVFNEFPRERVLALGLKWQF